MGAAAVFLALMALAIFAAARAGGDGRGLGLVALALAILVGGGLLLALLRRDRRLELLQAEARAEIELLERAALTDSLTGLGNHRAFQQQLDRELRLSWESGIPLCVLSLDVDGLRPINEGLGRQVADQALRGLAGHLREAAAADGTAFRVGADAFAVLMPGAGSLEGTYLAEQLHQRLSADGDPIELAVGIAERMARESRTKLAGRADAALVHAKRTSGRIVVHSPDLELTASLADPERDPEREALAAALARAVDAKDGRASSHSESVSSICVLLARELDLPPERVAKLRLAGLIHDVGMIGTPDEILRRPGALSAEEFEVIKQHPVKGAEIARAATLTEEAEWVLHHHERIDGRGYPSGLAGEEIALEARIILVAEALAALTADRPYRRRRFPAEALVEIQSHRGTQFDPTCVEALEAVLGRSRIGEPTAGGAAAPGGPNGRPAARPERPAAA